MAAITVERIVLGMLANNVYYLSDGEFGIVVDPSCKLERILDWLEGRSVDAIVLTHFHGDHIGAARGLKEATAAPVLAFADDVPYIVDTENAPSSLLGRAKSCPVDVPLADGDSLAVGSMEWKAIHTPGHSPGSMCLYFRCDGDFEAVPNVDIENSIARGGMSYSGILVAGDTLFEAGCGRTDFELGNRYDMEASLRRLAGLPDDTLVLPGHGNATTIAAERAYALSSDWL